MTQSESRRYYDKSICRTVALINLRHNRGLGIDTHLYLLDYRRYTSEIAPLLDSLLNGADTQPTRVAYEEASKVLVEAKSRREYPWTPFYSTPFSEEGIALLEGRIPDTYQGDRAPDVVTDPRLVREYCLRDYVCGVVVEGLCVPWDLDFPPVHVVTWSLGWGLYKHSKKFEDALCAEIYTRSARVPYDIYQGDELVDASLVRELAGEIARIASRAATYGRTSVIATFTGYFNPEPRVAPIASWHRTISRSEP